MLTEAEPPEALRMLRAGYVDVALVFRHYQQDIDSAPPVPADEGTRGRLLLDEPIFLVTRAAGPEPDLAAHADSKWIAGCERCRSALIRQCEQAGFTPKIAFTTDDYVAVQALVAAGLGVTTLPGLCLRAARHPGVTTAELPGARRHVFAMTYGQPPDPATTTRLIDVLGRAAAQPADPSLPPRRADAAPACLLPYHGKDATIR
jgi:DNA-binding transcriptional LysR family regulator